MSVSTDAAHAEKNSVIRTKQYFLLFLEKGVLVNYCALMRDSGTDRYEIRTADTQLSLVLLILKRTANVKSSAAAMLGRVYSIFASI